jgi:hypothetical protein
MVDSILCLRGRLFSRMSSRRVGAERIPFRVDFLDGEILTLQEIESGYGSRTCYARVREGSLISFHRLTKIRCRTLLSPKLVRKALPSASLLKAA